MHGLVVQYCTQTTTKGVQKNHQAVLQHYHTTSAHKCMLSYNKQIA